MVTDPFRFNQFVALYFDRIRYSRNCRGLMRVKALSALISSVSKLILKLLEGLNQSPNNAACSLMSVSPVSSVAGETKEIEPSAFCVHPWGSTPATSAHAPRAALLGKKMAFVVAKKPSSTARCR